FLTDQDMQASGISKDSYYTANVVLEDVGLFERERREPTSPPQEALDEEDAGDEARSSGRPYDMWRIVPAAVERFMAALEVGEQPAPPKRQEAEREKRRAKEKQAKAEREAHEARLRQEVQAAVQVKYDLKQAR